MGHVLKFSLPSITDAFSKCMNLFCEGCGPWGLHSKHLELIIGLRTVKGGPNFCLFHFLSLPTTAVMAAAIIWLGSPPQTFEHERPLRAKSLMCTNRSASDFNDSQSIARKP